MTKDEQIEMQELRQLVKALEEKVLYLLQIIGQKSIKKDSHNSHNSPSQDKSKPKRNESLRTKSSRQSGGQKGHKGSTLKMKSSPDKVEELKSNYCQSCGEDISGLQHKLHSKRQEVILPPIQPIYVEYQQYSCQCPCGHHQKAPYPQNN